MSHLGHAFFTSVELLKMQAEKEDPGLQYSHRQQG